MTEEKKNKEVLSLISLESLKIMMEEYCLWESKVSDAYHHNMFIKAITMRDNETIKIDVTSEFEASGLRTFTIDEFSRLINEHICDNHGIVFRLIKRDYIPPVK